MPFLELEIYDHLRHLRFSRAVGALLLLTGLALATLHRSRR